MIYTYIYVIYVRETTAHASWEWVFFSKNNAVFLYISTTFHWENYNKPTKLTERNNNLIFRYIIRIAQKMPLDTIDGL